MSEHAVAQPSERRAPTVDDFPETGINALATFHQRAWARVVDTLLVVPLLYFTIPLFIDPNADAAPENRVLLIWIVLAGMIPAGIYEVVAVAGWGTTVGKVALGTRVARYADGGTPTWSQAVLRALLPMAAAVAVFVVAGYPFIGAAAVYLSVLGNPLARGWHDQAGGTVVIRTR